MEVGGGCKCFMSDVEKELAMLKYRVDRLESDNISNRIFINEAEVEKVKLELQYIKQEMERLNNSISSLPQKVLLIVTFVNVIIQIVGHFVK